MSCKKEKISAKEPCKICGKPDWCFRLKFDDGGELHCCARIKEHTVSNSEEYILMKMKDTPIGTYAYYENKMHRDIFLKERKPSGERNKEFVPKSSEEPQNTSNNEKEINRKVQDTILIRGEDKVACDSRLDQVYRWFLDHLVLETDHEMQLRAEWNCVTVPQLFEKIVAVHPIKSLVPADWIRKRKITDEYQNRLRYAICKDMVKEIGEPIGVPGFYENGYGWSYSGTSGILFPIYNQRGQLIRLRLREDFPQIKGNFRDMQGIFTHSYDEWGIRQWKFTNTDESLDIMVYTRDEKLINLKSNGCPEGKAYSKYKNFTSVYEKLVDGEVVNGYGISGCRSGSHISLYAKKGDDFSVVYVTEGEKKAMVANMLLNVPVISLPGVGAFSMLFSKENEIQCSIMDYLREQMKLRMCVIAFDADKNTNANVLRAEQKLTLSLLQSGIKVVVVEWNAFFGKGLDDILIKGVMPSIYLCS